MKFILLASLILYTDIMINSFWHKTILTYESVVTYFDSSNALHLALLARSRLQGLLTPYSIPKSSTEDVMSRNITKMSTTDRFQIIPLSGFEFSFHAVLKRDFG